MTDHPPPDEPAQTVRARRERTARELRELRFVGPATADTLAAASVTADDIRGKAVSYVQLVELDVDPGVAARLRREHSLPWSSDQTSGARLRRRAEHVRHLRDDERSWIDESWDGDSPAPAPSTAAAPDGSGSTSDAEQAWRERGPVGTSSEPTTDDAFQTMNATHARSVSAAHGPRIDPNDHTVPELEEALEVVEDPEVLARVLREERASDGRTTAIDAIERRLEAVGVDPDEVADRSPGTASPEALAAGRGGAGEAPFTIPGTEAVAALSDADLVVPLRARLADFLEQLRQVAAGPDRSGRRFDARLETVDGEDWWRLSVALLLGLTSFSLLAVLVTALRPAVGLPVGALPLFLVTAVVGIIGVPLRWWGTAGGYSLTLLTGGLGLVAVGLVAVGAVGSPGTSPVTLLVYGVIAAALLATASQSSRARPPSV